MDPVGTKAGMLTLVPHIGRLALDWCDNQQVLTHLVSLRRQVVPGEGPWELDYDDEGIAILISDKEDEEPLLVETFLTRQLFVSTAGLLSASRALLALVEVASGQRGQT